MTKKNKVVLLLSVIGGILTVVLWQLGRSVRDGWGARGFDDEGGLGSNLQVDVLNPQDTFEKHPIALQYFKIEEFDSKGAGEAGTGAKMKISTLKMLDTARGMAGRAFKINSGYRTEKHNQQEGGVADSAHTRGYAADISATSLAIQKEIAKSLYRAGFRRFGIYRTFIHVDNDPAKPSPALWTGQGLSAAPFNPADLVIA